MIRAGAIALVVAACSSPSSSAPRPAAPAGDDCAGCHGAIAAEWRASRHAVAFTNGIFLREWEPERTAWCVTCHAPGVQDPTAVRDGDLAAERGVDCAACHERDGALVSRSRAPGSPHDTRIDPAFGSPSYCARCHEFAFPQLDRRGMHVADTDVAMQETVSQFATTTTAARGRDCGSCHQRTFAGHAFPGSHDSTMLRRAVALSACRTGDTVSIEIRNRQAAHNVPTGGVHRHIVLRAWYSAAPERMLEQYIGRRFEPRPTGGKRKILDTTLPPRATRTFELIPARLGGSDDAPLHLELRYVYIKEGSGSHQDRRRLSRVMHELAIPAPQLPRCR